MGSGGLVARAHTCGSIPPPPFRSLGNCRYRSEETVKAVGPFYLVSMPREVKDPTQGMEETCHGLTDCGEGHTNKHTAQFPSRTDI